MTHANTSNGIKIPTFVGKSWEMMLYLSSASLNNIYFAPEKENALSTPDLSTEQICKGSNLKHGYKL